jgi:hypothetical protein
MLFFGSVLAWNPSIQSELLEVEDDGPNRLYPGFHLVIFITALGSNTLSGENHTYKIVLS